MIARALRYCTRLFCTWHCVGVIEYHYGDNRGNNTVIFYFLENQFGERKIKFNPIGYSYPSYYDTSKKKRAVRELTFYKSRIVPWLLGRNDREIPTFRNKNCTKREFLKQLKDEDQNIVVKRDS